MLTRGGDEKGEEKGEDTGEDNVAEKEGGWNLLCV